jgi:hypothetical protein
MTKFQKSTFDKTLKVLLRAIPIIPVPELLDVVKDFTGSKDSISRKIEDADTSLKKSFELLEELQEDLESRAKNLKELKLKYEEYLNENKEWESKSNILPSSILDKFGNKNIVDTSKLITISNFSKTRNISQRKISKMLKSNSLDGIMIDGIGFILLNEKAESSN